ncbi:MAG TPA: hypothetical protein VFS82_02910 [Lysobacter sp.]|nr:hypothetical protein [Lysobacter sp.]
MHSLIDDFADHVFHNPVGPCLSLYQPTHRSHPDKGQDGIRFGNLVKAAEALWRERYPGHDPEPVMANLRKLGEERNFWNHTLDGLAVLASPTLFRVYRLQRPVTELAIVADSFHIKPLLRIVQSADRYQVLAINRHTAKLFVGNRDALDPFEAGDDFPATLQAVLGEDPLRGRPAVWSRGASASAAGVRDGQVERGSLVDADTEQFFRAVDRAVAEQFSRPSRLPLMLAALPEHQSMFRKLSHNAFLLLQGIDTHADAMSLETLRERAWQVMEPRYLERLAGLVDMFHAARARWLANDDIAQVARSAVSGRVSTLLVEADRQVSGRMDTSDGAVEFAGAGERDADLLDDIAEVVLSNGGQVVVVPGPRMPTTTGLAAIYRF